MHSYISCIVHCVWATKHRRPIITPYLQQRLWPYLGGIAREHNMKALAIGGVEDHVHVLVSIPATLCVSKCVQLLKGGSAKWVHDTFVEFADFKWQKGYGAFSIGISAVEDTRRYIQRQREHHAADSYRDEMAAFFRTHGMQYVEHDLE